MDYFKRRVFRDAVAKGRASKTIIIHILKNGPKTAADIVGEASFSSGHVYGSLPKMEKEGLLEKKDEGERVVYGITPKAEKFYEESAFIYKQLSDMFNSNKRTNQ